jgi:hypothetical protein
VISEAPTESNIRDVLQELPPVYTRAEALAILEAENINSSSPDDPSGISLALAREYGIYPDKLKVL